ncbi:MAG: hypothetical protein CSA25_06110 [Desulfobacter postgatei]|uniref:Uncharacterized protein n=1 Tax=Desulfobacter postgatei TaxID=2293 RepID=A0A2G6MQC6_9BACT|nr:MAG: hypothetical protein CSA25_06110 [Desulfobacter postgatei]
MEIEKQDLPPNAASPLGRIYHGLSELVLGRGGSEHWQEIESQTRRLTDRKWFSANYPDLSFDEAEQALYFIGLPVYQEKSLFESQWFDHGHKLAPFLNAKPSELSRAIDSRLK